MYSLPHQDERLDAEDSGIDREMAVEERSCLTFEVVREGAAGELTMEGVEGPRGGDADTDERDRTVDDPVDPGLDVTGVVAAVSASSTSASEIAYTRPLCRSPSTTPHEAGHVRAHFDARTRS